ncbi:MAG: GGDEF domain-containing protein [Phycisphaeraceae bacterium]
MNQDLLDHVLQSPRLPSLPSVALEVIELVQRRDTDLRQIATTISHDPALTGKILKTVNSSFYGQSQPVGTISQALVILGLNSIKTLALGFTLVGNLRKSSEEGFDHITFWKRCLYTAVAARALAKAVGLVEQEEAFLGGLMQDLGMLALSETLGEEYLELTREAQCDHRRLVLLEREHLDTDHAFIGAHLARSWKLPALLIAPIEFHESPDDGPEALQPFIRVVALGNRVADIFVFESPDEALATYYAQALEWFGFDREQAEPMLKAIHTDTVEMRRLFDLPTGPLSYPQNVLAKAHDALFNISLQQSMQTTELEKQNEKLVAKASTDSLTGIANRGQFNEVIRAEFAKAQKSKNPLSLLFLDTDHFKRFNDTFGHQLGDRVLVEQALVLRMNIAKSATVARYGGEEFAVIMPNTNRKSAAREADRLRMLIAESVVRTDDGQSLSITASIGVATFEGNLFETPEEMIKAADRGVYAAKAAGRNCVRVFAPRAARQSA